MRVSLAFLLFGAAVLVLAPLVAGDIKALDESLRKVFAGLWGGIMLAAFLVSGIAFLSERN